MYTNNNSYQHHNHFTSDGQLFSSPGNSTQNIQTSSTDYQHQLEHPRHEAKGHPHLDQSAGDLQNKHDKRIAGTSKPIRSSELAAADYILVKSSVRSYRNSLCETKHCNSIHSLSSSSPCLITLAPQSLSGVPQYSSSSVPGNNRCDHSLILSTELSSSFANNCKAVHHGFCSPVDPSSGRQFFPGNHLSFEQIIRGNPHRDAPLCVKNSQSASGVLEPKKDLFLQEKRSLSPDYLPSTSSSSSGNSLSDSESLSCGSDSSSEGGFDYVPGPSGETHDHRLSEKTRISNHSIILQDNNQLNQDNQTPRVDSGNRRVKCEKESVKSNNCNESSQSSSHFSLPKDIRQFNEIPTKSSQEALISSVGAFVINGSHFDENHLNLDQLEILLRIFVQQEKMRQQKEGSSSGKHQNQRSFGWGSYGSLDPNRRSSSLSALNSLVIQNPAHSSADQYIRGRSSHTHNTNSNNPVASGVPAKTAFSFLPNFLGFNRSLSPSPPPIISSSSSSSTAVVANPSHKSLIKGQQVSSSPPSSSQSLISGQSSITSRNKEPQPTQHQPQPKSKSSSPEKAVVKKVKKKSASVITPGNTSSTSDPSLANSHVIQSKSTAGNLSKSTSCLSSTPIQNQDHQQKLVYGLSEKTPKNKYIQLVNNRGAGHPSSPNQPMVISLDHNVQGHETSQQVKSHESLVDGEKPKSPTKKSSGRVKRSNSSGDESSQRMPFISAQTMNTRDKSIEQILNEVLQLTDDEKACILASHQQSLVQKLKEQRKLDNYVNQQLQHHNKSNQQKSSSNLSKKKSYSTDSLNLGAATKLFDFHMQLHSPQAINYSNPIDYARTRFINNVISNAALTAGKSAGILVSSSSPSDYHLQKQPTQTLVNEVKVKWEANQGKSAPSEDIKKDVQEVSANTNGSTKDNNTVKENSTSKKSSGHRHHHRHHYNLNAIDAAKNPVKPFLSRGSVAERVLLFEKCPEPKSQRTLANTRESKRAKSPVLYNHYRNHHWMEQTVRRGDNQMGVNYPVVVIFTKTYCCILLNRAHISCCLCPSFLISVGDLSLSTKIDRSITSFPKLTGKEVRKKYYSC